ncbi:PQQ-binding-like beta-propeller repeat protein [Actinomadura scrupuli]|uniref:outer membrane protein assembly factor BamB family protein n=1 Tax=Actinomadura scrupuli TaxID=559629 RepID=UPI003D95C6BC
MYGYQKSERRIRILPLLIGLAGAVLVGLALTVQVRSWGALGTEAGGSCGTNRGPCPRGTSWTIPLSIIALLLVVPVAIAGISRSGTRAIGWIVAVAFAVAGVLPGAKVFDLAHGVSLNTVWAVPPDRPAEPEALGSWQNGSTVVRARFDGVAAYDVATGRQVWTYTIPAPEVLCAMSRTVEGGVGLVGHAAEGMPCTYVSAVDLASGRELWEKDLPAAQLPSSMTADVVAVSRETAVLQTQQTLQGFTLREGARRWEQKVTDRCHFDKVIAGGDQVVADLGCIGAPPRIRAIDAVTGRTRWEVPVPIRTPSANLTLLSAAPAVVYVQESGQRGTRTVTIFDAKGRASEPIQRDDGRRRLDIDPHGFSAAPVYRLFVQDGLLIVSASLDGGRESVVAFGLSDGRERWSKQVSDVRTMQVEAGRVVYLDDQTISPHLRSMSLRDGKETYLGVTGFRWVTANLALYLTGGRYVFVADRATTPDTHPIAAVQAR